MSFSARINSYEASVKRLEGQVAKIQGHCPLCRLVGRSWWASPKRPQTNPEYMVEAVCMYCHSKYDFNLSWSTEDERKAWRLFHSFTPEDQYTNPVAHAVSLWLQYRVKQKKGITQRQRATPHGRAKGRTKGQRLFTKLREEIAVLRERERKSLLDKYGGPPFPNHRDLIEEGQAKATIKRKTSGYVNGLYALEEEITTYMICAELEEIIWGEVLPQTKSTIEKIDLAMDELINAKEAEEAQKRQAKEAEQRETEEKVKKHQNEERRKNIDIENRYRRGLKLPLLPDDYEGSFTSHSELMTLRHYSDLNRSLSMNPRQNLPKPSKTFQSAQAGAPAPPSRINARRKAERAPQVRTRRDGEKG